MTTLLEGARQLVTRGTDLGARIDGLGAATAAARGRVDDALLDDVDSVAGRAAGRVRLSATHTVVAIAGATGSGKSSTFNALTGLELSSTGVRRPTTSWATACVWGSEGAEELLQWLGIPPRHQTMRESMLDTDRADEPLDGVVLMDLPDHDSTEVSHHLEVDRLVELADLLVWVLDPQKYADAAIHDRYLAPLRTHADVMVVVLNHIDTVPEDRRQSMVDDVRRLLDNDGLGSVPVYPVSARESIGMEQLRGEIAQRARQKRLIRSRIEADLRTAAGRLAEASGAGRARAVPAHRAADLDKALGEACGVPVVVEAVERSTRRRVLIAVSWPPVGWILRRGTDPLERLGLEVGDAAPALSGRSGSLVATAPVQRSRVDAELRALADDVGRGLGSPWVAAVRRAATSRTEEVGDRLDTALAGTDIGADRLPGWAVVVRVVQWLLLLGLVAGVVYTVVLALTGGLADAHALVGVPWPAAVAVGCLVLGLVLWFASRDSASSAAQAKADEVRRRLGGVVHDVTQQLVVAPVDVELAAHATVMKGLAAAQK